MSDSYSSSSSHDTVDPRRAHRALHPYAAVIVGCLVDAAFEVTGAPLVLTEEGVKVCEERSRGIVASHGQHLWTTTWRLATSEDRYGSVQSRDRKATSTAVFPLVPLPSSHLLYDRAERWHQHNRLSAVQSPNDDHPRIIGRICDADTYVVDVGVL